MAYMRFFQKALLGLLAIVLSLTFFFEAPPIKASAADGSTTVYKTKTGDCYHNENCSCLRKSKIAVSLDDAVAAGLTPCSKCKPATLTDSGSGIETATAVQAEEFVLNTNSKVFHYANCSSAKRIKSSNRATSTLTRQELEDEGYSPCKNCIK